MTVFEEIGIAVPEILLPKDEALHPTWAVIACDQYTSQPEYWKDVESQVADKPSTLHLIYPEVYLDDPDSEARIRNIETAMQKYVDDDILETHHGFVYVERTIGSVTRKGLVVCLDLDAYDFNKGSESLVRATEGTILSRLPPRIKVRKGAPLELPHIMVLIDDPEDTVIGPLTKSKDNLQSLYDFELMLSGGHLAGYAAADESTVKGVADALSALKAPEVFESKYSVDAGTAPLLFAMGDGNHSLATAKAIWEEVKGAGAEPNDPRRFALVELVNLHDPAMVFEPIHRVLFDIREGKDILDMMKTHWGDRARFESVADLESLVAQVESSTSSGQRFGAVSASGYTLVEVTEPDANLAVGTLQNFLDPLVEAGDVREIDYVHGTPPVDTLGRKAGNLGFFLPGMDKHDLFKSVIVDGALPRKTFSMGEADEKRFYMECRRIR